ncbi:MAG: hypothetical protein NTW35_02455 [Candidatus Nomurabacteria bacterium]|nr:hypothetical protein [Candidatus Nomurabacteria bacterium]
MENTKQITEDNQHSIFLRKEFLIPWFFIILDVYILLSIFFSIVDFYFLICSHASGSWKEITTCPLIFRWYELIPNLLGDHLGGGISFIFILLLLVPFYLFGFIKGYRSLKLINQSSISYSKKIWLRFFTILFFITPVVYIFGISYIGILSNKTRLRFYEAANFSLEYKYYGGPVFYLGFNKVDKKIGDSSGGSVPMPTSVEKNNINTTQIRIYSISELGISFKLSNGENYNLVYQVIKISRDQALNSVAFSTREFENIGCDIKNAPLGVLTYDSNMGGQIVGNVRGSNLYYIYPNLNMDKKCISMSQAGDLKEALKTVTTN